MARLSAPHSGHVPATGSRVTLSVSCSGRGKVHMGPPFVLRRGVGETQTGGSCRARSSPGKLAAVDEIHGTVDEGGVVGCEKAHQLGDLQGLAEAGGELGAGQGTK